MGCFGCFGSNERSRQSPNPFDDDDDTHSHDGDVTSDPGGDDDEEVEEVEEQSRSKRSEDILKYKLQNGLICRQFPVKETNKLIRGENDDGKKTINEFVHVRKIGSGSYGKVVLYRSTVDEKHYAIKQLEKKKAEYAERMKNKVAAIHKEAEERRAMIEAKHGEDTLKAEETAAKYRATGIVPKATCGCF